MTNPAFQIRAALTADAAELARLNASVHAEHTRQRPDFFKPAEAAQVESWLRALLDKPTTRCWLAEAGADAVGYLLMREYQRSETLFCWARHWHEIDHLSVEAPFRRQGIGRALMQTALAAAAATGAQQVELASWSFNTDAHAMFQRCGFAARLLRFDANVSSS